MSKSIKLTSATNNILFSIRVNEKLQHRSNSFSKEAVETYKERMMEGREFTPVQVIRLSNPTDSRYNGDYLCGGFHRVEAYRAALKEAKGNPSIKVKPLKFHLNTTVDSWDALVETSMIEGYMDNETNGVQLTKKDRDDLVIHLYHQGMPQKQIAKRTKIHTRTVTRILEPLITAKRELQHSEVKRILKEHPEISDSALAEAIGINRRTAKKFKETVHNRQCLKCTPNNEFIETPTVHNRQCLKCTPSKKISKISQGNLEETQAAPLYTLEQALSLIEDVMNNENQDMNVFTPAQHKLIMKLIRKAQKTTEVRLGKQIESLEKQLDSLKTTPKVLPKKQVKSLAVVPVKPKEIHSEAPQLPLGITPKQAKPYLLMTPNQMREEASEMETYGDHEESSMLYKLASWKETTCKN